MAQPGRHALQLTRSVDVGLRVLWRLHLDDQLNAVDVQATGSHVSGHQHLELAGAIARQRGLTLALGNVAVQGARAHDLSQGACREGAGAEV